VQQQLFIHGAGFNFAKGLTDSNRAVKRFVFWQLRGAQVNWENVEVFLIDETSMMSVF
jgi:hypothetical protein